MVITESEYLLLSFLLGTFVTWRWAKAKARDEHEDESQKDVTFYYWASALLAIEAVVLLRSVTEGEGESLWGVAYLIGIAIAILLVRMIVKAIDRATRAIKEVTDEIREVKDDLKRLREDLNKDED